MEDAIKWGPLLVKWKWIVLLASVGVGYLLVKLRLKGMEQDQRSSILDTITHSVWVSIGIWKFSYILFNPMSVLSYPMTLVYFSGGYKGWILAVVSVFIYLLYKAKKQDMTIHLYIILLGLGYGGASALYHGISWVTSYNDRWFHLGEILLSVVFVWWFYRRESVSQAFHGMVWLGLSQIFIHYFKDVHVGMWWGLSRDQLIFLAISLIGFIGAASPRFIRNERGAL
ncbi:hypothetical protein [Ammoniphilus sp. CFH 90114]|uniref:hypothetical protein n=1 Tax=Ammoniphilus sp. CFH 90114 TaxID=2493665 RepID=UPI00100EB583|nr:hypothetical protein [Ammoniphilus sp. CFH 90114]RXT07932.1 hypothetical protein EIZ39_10975 [Ammoniphilus sp. CFH 90114]